MAKFFINRPIVAMVISILMVLIGVVTMLGLPTAQFPNIADPMIQVKATYPGADAQTIAESVATPLEQQMSGVTGMNYVLIKRQLRRGNDVVRRLSVGDRHQHRPDSGTNAEWAGRAL